MPHGVYDSPACVAACHSGRVAEVQGATATVGAAAIASASIPTAADAGE